VQLFGAELEHLHQARLVQHRVGVGRADQAGHAAGHGGGHFAFEHAFVLMARLAQARRQVHQARRDDAAGGVDRLVGREVGGDGADGDDAACCDGHIGNRRRSCWPGRSRGRS
jgi:hypothetical protein